MDLPQKAIPFITTEWPEIEAIYLFGSYAEETATPASDIDLAVLAARSLDPVARFELQEKIASNLNKDIDLVDLRQVDTVFRIQILSKGKILFMDPKAKANVERFEAHTLADYARLNEERGDILKDIETRKKIRD